MSSCSIKYKREEFSGKSDREVAEATALKYGYVAIVRYKSDPHGDYTDFGCCINDEQVNGYLHSPHCRDAEVIYDARPRSLLITANLLRSSRCANCGSAPTDSSLVLGSPDNVYFCPRCARLFCPVGYQSALPLTDGTSGYGMCPSCQVEVQRAIPGDYGKVPLKLGVRARRWWQF